MSRIDYSKWDHLDDYESDSSCSYEEFEKELDENENDPNFEGRQCCCPECGRDMSHDGDEHPDTSGVQFYPSPDEMRKNLRESLKKFVSLRSGTKQEGQDESTRPTTGGTMPARPDDKGDEPSAHHLRSREVFKSDPGQHRVWPNGRQACRKRKRGYSSSKKGIKRRLVTSSVQKSQQCGVLAIPKHIRKSSARFRSGRLGRFMKESLEMAHWFKKDAIRREMEGSPERENAQNQPPYVKLHPADRLESLEPEFRMHPKDFIPRKDEEGIFRRWGIPRPQDSISSFMSRMLVQNNYRLNPDYPATPEEQFVGYLKREKEKKLEKVSHEFLDRDFVLKISMCDLKPEIWRRFKVSGAMNLNTLQDKVITPTMGWVRNYHGYMYTDQNDGTVYGPVKCDAIDIGCWKHVFAIDFYDDAKVPLGLVLQKEGDWLLYEYDLGDHWAHQIIVEKILGAEESTGSCEVIAGAMRCPPEDSNGLEGKGNHSYQELLDMLPPRRKWKGPRSQTLSSKVKKMLCEAESAMNVSQGRFDPYEFDLEKVKKEVKTALTSRASVRSGSKKMIFPISQSISEMTRPGGMYDSETRAGEKMVYQRDSPFGCYMLEKSSIRRDEVDMALCHNCGNPNNLKLCTACRMIRYCSKECQKIDWKNGHNKECKNLKTEHSQVKAETVAQKKQKATK